MPDGRSDTAIDFYASSFCREVLDAAHPVRFSKERITYGSDVLTGFRGHVWPANTNDEMADGGRLVGGRRVPLARLADGSRPYGRLIDNMLRPFGTRQWKDHYLTTYADDRPVAFTAFDFDRHPPKGPSGPPSIESDEWLAIDDAFWERVSMFRGLAARLGADVMWVTSPGRWLADGGGLPCRMPGLYAIVRHAPRTPSTLRPLLAALKERHGLEAEASWDARNRNVRIPGQCFLDPCRVDPARRSMVPVRDPEARTERERNMFRLAAAVEGYGALGRAGGERLIHCGEGPLRVRREGGAARRAADGLVTSPSGKTATGERGSGSARRLHEASDSTDPTRWLSEPDTFRVLHESGLLRRALRKFGWDPGRVAEAVGWAAPRLKGLRPTSSATCSDDGALASFIRRHYRWGCRTYDPEMAKAGARLRARLADAARIAPSLRLDDRALEAYLTHVAGLSGEEMGCVQRFRALERRYSGRIACRTLYAAFGGPRRFKAFQALHPILHVAQEHSQSQGRCRQWTLASHVVRSVRTLSASAMLLAILRGEGGRVIYIETRRHDRWLRRRISAVGPALEAGPALESGTVMPAARGPPAENAKNRRKRHVRQTRPRPRCGTCAAAARPATSTSSPSWRRRIERRRKRRSSPNHREDDGV